MNIEAVQTTPAPVANTAFGAEVKGASYDPFNAETWQLPEFTIPSQTGTVWFPGKKDATKPVFYADTKFGRLVITPDNAPTVEALGEKRRGTLTVGMARGTRIVPLDEAKPDGLYKFSSHVTFVRFE